MITMTYDEELFVMDIPSEAKTQILKVNKIPPPLTDIKARLLTCLTDPINSLPLSDLIRQRGKLRVLIIVDDATRPNKHTKLLLPVIIDYLLQEKVEKTDIKIIIACGSHSAPSQAAVKNKILGEQIFVHWENNIIIHNQTSNNVLIGTSSYGTPIEIDQRVLDAGLVISLSDSEYHYFAGVAGTVKQLFPGCAGKNTIARNHPQMFDYKHGFKPTCRLGNTKDNPVISDILEMVDLIKKKTLIFCIDAIMESNNVLELYAGDIQSLHKKAIKTLKPLRVIEVETSADLVIVPAGSLGINLYQSAKAIHAGWNAVADGGDILVLAPCKEGHGNQNYLDTMVEINGKSLEEAMSYVIDNKCSIETFKIGNQKVVDILRVLNRCKIHLLTEMDSKLLKETFKIDAVKQLSSIKESLDSWIEKWYQDFKLNNNHEPLIYILTDAGYYVNVKERQ